MLESLGLEDETHGEGESVLQIHGSHIADSFFPWSRSRHSPVIASSDITAEDSRAAGPFHMRSASNSRLTPRWPS